MKFCLQMSTTSAAFGDLKKPLAWIDIECKIGPGEGKGEGGIQVRNPGLDDLCGEICPLCIRGALGP